MNPHLWEPPARSLGLPRFPIRTRWRYACRFWTFLQKVLLRPAHWHRRSHGNSPQGELAFAELIRPLGLSAPVNWHQAVLAASNPQRGIISGALGGVCRAARGLP